MFKMSILHDDPGLNSLRCCLAEILSFWSFSYDAIKFSLYLNFENFVGKFEISMPYCVLISY